MLAAYPFPPQHVHASNPASSISFSYVLSAYLDLASSYAYRYSDSIIVLMDDVGVGSEPRWGRVRLRVLTRREYSKYLNDESTRGRYISSSCTKVQG